MKIQGINELERSYALLKHQLQPEPNWHTGIFPVRRSEKQISHLITESVEIVRFFQAAFRLYDIQYWEARSARRSVRRLPFFV